MLQAMDGRGARWLDDHEQRVWRTYLLATRLLDEQLERDLQHHAGMPFHYYDVLVRLSEAPGHSLRMSELADRSRSSRSRLSHAIARLQRAGWVERRSCPTDGRGALAVLTEHGMAALHAAAPRHVESVRSLLFDAFSDHEIAELGRLSLRLVEHLSSLGLLCPELAVAYGVDLLPGDEPAGRAGHARSGSPPAGGLRRDGPARGAGRPAPSATS